MSILRRVDTELRRAAFPTHRELADTYEDRDDSTATVAKLGVDYAEQVVTAEMSHKDKTTVEMLRCFLGSLGTIYTQLCSEEGVPVPGDGDDEPVKRAPGVTISPAELAGDTEPVDPTDTTSFLDLDRGQQLLVRYGMLARHSVGQMPALERELPAPTSNLFARWREQGFARQVQFDEHGNRFLRFTVAGAKWLRQFGITLDVEPDQNEAAIEQGGVHPVDRDMQLLLAYARDAEHWPNYKPILGVNVEYPANATLLEWAYTQRLVFIERDPVGVTRLAFRPKGANWVAGYDVSVTDHLDDEVKGERPENHELFLSYGYEAQRWDDKAPMLGTNRLDEPEPEVLNSWLSYEWVRTDPVTYGTTAKIEFTGKGKDFLARYGIILY